jgi:hypothetical protein
MGNSMNEGGSMADNFEKNWRDAFENIEISPDQSVWQKVDHSLASTEAAYYRKKALIYKWAAVAAMVFAVSVSIPQYFNQDRENVFTSDFVAMAEKATSSEFVVREKTAEIPPVETSASKLSDIPGPSLPIQLANEKQSAEDRSHGDVGTQERTSGFLAFELDEEGTVEVADLNPYHGNVPDIRIYQKVNYAAATALPVVESAETKKYWAGVGVGSSTFDPNYQLNQPNEVVSAVMRSETNFVSRVPENVEQDHTFSDRITEGVNYQFALNMGIMLGKRMSLESGLSYAEAQLTSQTDLIVENKIFSKSVAVTSEIASVKQISQVTNTQDIVEYERADISLDNTFQFASIPLKAGYQILNKKVQLKINAGLITNIYMGNKLTDATNQVASLELYPGANSPYRTVSFSGITGIAIGYNLFDHLDLTVEPNFSQALQPLTKDESNFNATPNGFGMLAGLRYRFGQ